jgi:hypothetical protein
MNRKIRFLLPTSKVKKLDEKFCVYPNEKNLDDASCLSSISAPKSYTHKLCLLNLPSCRLPAVNVMSAFIE